MLGMTNEILTKTYTEGGSHHEVLLLQSKFLPLKEVIVGVQNSRNVFRQVPVQYGLNVVAIID